MDGSTVDSFGPSYAGGGSGGSAGSSASAGQVSGGSAGEMTSAAGTSAGQVTAGSGGGFADCASYADHGSWTLLVQIKNEMTQTLYLGHDATSCAIQRLFKVETGSNTELPSLDNCHTSCQAMMETGPTSCPAICAMPSTVTLQPGETLLLPWDGRFGVEQTLPQQCLPGALQAPASCVQAQRIEANAFTFSAQAGTRQECLQPGGTCTCNLNQNGGCTSPGSLIGGTIYTSEYFVKLEPGEPSPGGEPPYIGILFRDEM